MFPTFVLYELTILMVLTLTLVIMKVWRFHCFLKKIFSVYDPSISFTDLLRFLPVHHGRTGFVNHFASELQTHTVDCLGGSGSGQRVLLCSGQPGPPSRHHFQRGQWLPF